MSARLRVWRFLALALAACAALVALVALAAFAAFAAVAAVAALAAFAACAALVALAAFAAAARPPGGSSAKEAKKITSRLEGDWCHLANWLSVAVCMALLASRAVSRTQRTYSLCLARYTSLACSGVYRRGRPLPRTGMIPAARRTS